MKNQIVDCAAHRTLSCVRLSHQLFWTVTTVVLPCAQAFAQSVDYGTMEQMFGETVTTSATGSPQRATEVPADMTILTQDDIRRTGLDNLPDILALVPGLQVRRSSFHTADVAVRGYGGSGNPRLLVLVDGRPVYDDFFGFVDWAAIPVELDQIRQIEVVRGPNSALFGFNAASGVINIITYDPLYDNVEVATVRTGTQGLAEGSAVATLRKPGVGGIQLSAGGIRADEFAPEGTQGPNQDHPVKAEFNVVGRYRIRPNVEFTLGGGASDANTYDSNAGIYTTYRSNDLRAELAAETAFGRVGLSFYRNEDAINFLHLLSEDDVVYDAQLSDTVKLGASHILRANLEYRDNSSISPFSAGRWAIEILREA